MCWNQKKKQENEAPARPVSGRIVNRINKYVTDKQTKLAGFLNRKAEGLSTGGKKVFLFVFCLLSGGMSLYLIVTTLWHPTEPDLSLKPKAISVPQHWNKTGEETLYPRVLVTEEDMKEVRTYKRYMDSLKNAVNGKPLYDSILTARAGLFDTVSMLEELYLLQQK